MRSLLKGIGLLTHAQLVMAFSAVCYVETAALVIAGRGASSAWLAAAGFGTLGIYLLDSVRSADREDGMSQPVRAAIFRRMRGVAMLWALLSLVLAVFFSLAAGPSAFALLVLVILGVLGAAYLLPVLPSRSGLVTLKSHAWAKPFAISIAWLVGALLIAIETVPSNQDIAWSAVLSFSLLSFPLLLLDSLWLDRRDRVADAAFDHPTLAGELSARLFLFARVGLFLLPLIAIPFTGFFLVFSFWIGAVWLLLIEPGRLAYEASRVWLAAFWRMTALIGALTLIG